MCMFKLFLKVGQYHSLTLTSMSTVQGPNITSISKKQSQDTTHRMLCKEVHMKSTDVSVEAGNKSADDKDKNEEEDSHG